MNIAIPTLPKWMTRKRVGIACFVLLLSTWHFYSPSTYLSFQFGIIVCLLFELLFAWIYLGKRAKKAGKKKITLELAKIELDKIFDGEVGNEYHPANEDDLEKKPFFENNL